MLRAALCCLLLALSGCKTFLYLVRSFERSAIPGQDPRPLSDSAREKFADPKKLMADVEYLSAPDCNGRYIGTPGNALARAYIKERMAQSGLVVSEQTFSFTEYDRDKQRDVSMSGANVLGVLRGEDRASKWIVITAHYDHLGRSQRKNNYYPGADDNAAGVSALFALAEYFSAHPTQHNLLFVALDAEEIGLVGSVFFLKENPIAAKENIAFNLNLDMISRSEASELFAITPNKPEQDALRQILFDLQSKVGFKLMVSVDDRSIRAMASDHAVFAKYKIPFLYLGVADHEDYHKPSDTPDRIEPGFYTAVVDGIVLMLTALDQTLPLSER